MKKEHNVDVEWRPFYLYLDTPPEGRELPEYVKRARANGSEERLRSIASSYGMEFVSVPRIYNTRLAHEATEYAREHGNPARLNSPIQRDERGNPARLNSPIQRDERGKGNEFHRVVFRKVYAEGQDISRWEVLRAVAEEVGLNADEMQHEVESEKYTALVADQVRWAYQIGVTGVPTYVINNRYGIVGAQPYEVFRNTLEQIAGQNE